MMEENRLIRFVKDSLENHGAVVDRLEESLYEGLIPQDMAYRLGFSEDQLFDFNSSHQSQDPQIIHISYNSEVLERFGLLIDDEGLFTAMSGSPDLYLKQQGFEKLISEKISFFNAIHRFVRREESYNAYLWLNFKYTAISEEKQDGIVPILINEYSLSSLPVPEIFKADFLNELVPVTSREQFPVDLMEPQPLDHVYRRACAIARKRIDHVLADFEKSLNRRMRRDIERLIEYYQTLIQQIEEKIKKKQLSKEEMEREESRIQATQLELKRKAVDQQERYSLKVEVDLINALRIFMPVVKAVYKIKRKQKARKLDLIWNPLIKGLELPVCESCHEETGGLFLCDDRLHFLCPQCYVECSTCGKHFCRACHPQGCPRCAKLSSPQSH